MNGHARPIETARLRLLAAGLEHAEAELLEPNGLGELLGVALPDGWPPGEVDRGALEYFRDAHRRGGEAVRGWLSWYALTRDGRELVACGGYVGRPDGGRVEIGYSVVAAFQRRGFATELADGLVRRAFEQPDVHLVFAHAFDANVASTGVLRRCGFVRIAEGPQAGVARWELGRPVDAGAGQQT